MRFGICQVAYIINNKIKSSRVFDRMKYMLQSDRKMSDNRCFAHSIATLAKHLLQPDFAHWYVITCRPPVISMREEQQRERSVKSNNRIKKQLPPS